jgi:dihydrofolate synthase/folylpolyglutamate synthase
VAADNPVNSDAANPEPSRAVAQRIVALLAPLTNYERNRKDPPRWSLDNIRALLGRPGATPAHGLAVQVGGSKGKGTTALYLDALARRVGLRSGVYVSPHVVDVTERVQLDGAPAPQLEAVVRELVAWVQQRAASDVSFFEVMTAAAVECYARAGVDLAVYEVGLGGRLDATTGVPVDASILTNVELEHTELLGDTEVAIAGEKAWVVRPGKFAVTGARGEALAVVEARARAVGANLLVLGRDLQLRDVTVSGDAYRATLDDAGERLPLCMPGAARFELDALALAAATLRRLRPDLRPAIAAALAQVTWRPTLPARCERILTPTGLCVIDGAHTERSLAVLAAEAARLAPGHRWPLLFGSAAGKRWRQGLSGLLPIVDRVYVTALEGTASEDPALLGAWLQAQGVPVELVPDAQVGLDALRRRPAPWLVAGSFYLAGAVRSLLAVASSPSRS